MILEIYKKSKLIFFPILFVLIIFLTSSTFAAETENANEQMFQLESILNSSSSYSAFQTTMLLNSAQSLIDTGISYEDTEEVISNGIEKSVNAYNIKKLLDVILENQQSGLPSESLINKINEGLAKSVDNNTIVTVISAKAENIKIASEMLNEAQQGGLNIDDSLEIVDVLVDSLENNVPRESLSWLLNTATDEGRSIEEITQISGEFSNLSLTASDLGLSSEEISCLFEKAIDDEGIESICENIQDSLEAEMITAKMERSEGKDTASADSGSGGTALTSQEDDPLDIGETPAQDGGEAPIDTGGNGPTDPASPTPPPAEDDSPPPPEN